MPVASGAHQPSLFPPRLTLPVGVIARVTDPDARARRLALERRG